MAPTHLPKSWKRQIAKMNLSSENQKILLGKVWSFALRMEICDYAALDMEWEAITRFALSLAQVEPEGDLVLLPAHLRLAHQASFSGISSSAPIDTRDFQTQLKLYQNITECLDLIAERVEKAKSATRLDQQSVQSLRSQLLHIAEQICSAGVQDENLETMMAIHRELHKRTRGQQKGSTNATTGPKSSSGSAVTAEIVVSAMQNIYSLARCWCQRVTCQGFTMQRKSSTWSEISNNSIRSFISPSKRMNGEYSLSSFIMDVDQWIHRQFELSYQANKVTYRFKSDILSDHHVTLLQQVLCNGATSDVLNKVLCSTMKNEFTVHDSEELELTSLCSIFRKRAGEFMKRFDIETSEVKCFKATSMPVALKQPSTGTGPAEDIDQEHIDQVHASLQQVSEIASAGGAVLAVYFPGDGGCKIPFFNQDRPVGHGVPFFCSCMQHTASGLPCPHMMAWILRKPRSVWTVIFLSHPAFIRGHPVA